MNNQENQNQSKQVVLSVLAVAILIVAVVGISFAVFTFSQAGTKNNTIVTGSIKMTYTEGTNGINITNAMPMTDVAGKAQTGDGNIFDFTVASTISGTATINYEVAAVKAAASTMADSDVRIYLEKKGEGNVYASAFAPAGFTATNASAATAIGSPMGSMVLYSGTHTTSTTDSFRLRMWMAESAVVTGTSKTYTVTIDVNGKTTA